MILYMGSALALIIRLRGRHGIPYAMDWVTNLAIFRFIMSGRHKEIGDRSISALVIMARVSLALALAVFALEFTWTIWG
jgi:hypothetical protein